MISLCVNTDDVCGVGHSARCYDKLGGVFVHTTSLHRATGCCGRHSIERSSDIDAGLIICYGSLAWFFVLGCSLSAICGAARLAALISAPAFSFESSLFLTLLLSSSGASHTRTHACQNMMMPLTHPFSRPRWSTIFDMFFSGVVLPVPVQVVLTFHNNSLVVYSLFLHSSFEGKPNITIISLMSPTWYPSNLKRNLSTRSS